MIPILNFRSADGAYLVHLKLSDEREDQPIDELAGQISQACDWSRIPLSPGSLETVSGKDILQTFRQYLDQSDLSRSFKFTVNGERKDPVGISTKDSNLKPLIKWIIKQITPGEPINDRQLNRYVDKLYEELPELEDLAVAQRAGKGDSGLITRIKRRVRSQDTTPPTSSLISREEIQNVLALSGGSLDDNAIAVQKNMRQKAIKTHLKEIPGIAILSSLSINAFAQADNRIKEIFPHLHPLNTGDYRLKLDSASDRPTKFSVQLLPHGFIASQSRIYSLQKYNRNGGERPLTTLATIRVNWTVNSDSSENCNGNLSLSKIKFTEGMRERKQRMVIDIFLKAIIDQYTCLMNENLQIRRLSARSEKIDLMRSAHDEGAALSEALFSYVKAEFNLASNGDDKNYEKTTFNSAPNQKFDAWFLQHILQVQEPNEKVRELYRWDVHAQYALEERYYREQLYRYDLDIKKAQASLNFPITNSDESYYGTLKKIVNDSKKCKALVKAIKECQSQEEAGHMVTKSVCMENPTILSNRFPHLDKLKVMAYADSKNTNSQFQMKFDSFTTGSTDFYIESDSAIARKDRVYFSPQTGKFDIEQKHAYSIRQKNDHSEVLGFTVESAVTGRDWEYLHSQSISGIEICDKAYPPIALRALQELKNILEND